MRTMLSFLMAAMFSVAAQAQQVERIDITEAGIYRSEITGSAASPGTPTGKTNIVAGVTLIQKTTTIPVALGTSFGFRYVVVGQPNDAAVALRVVSHYPSPGLRDPATGNTYMRSEYSVQKKLGVETYKGYSFEHAWEQVAGTWTFEVWQGDRKLGAQSFTVVKP